MSIYSRLFSKFLKEETCNVCANELKPGDVVKDINPGCKEYKAKGVVKSVKKVPDGNRVAGNLVELEIKNNGKNYKKGDRIKKTEIQLKKIKESFLDYITEASLSRANLNANPPRIDTLIKKIENKEPFVETGKILPTLVIDADDAWFEDLKATKQLKTSYIPDKSGRQIFLSALQKTAEFGSTGQRGGEFEDRFVNDFKNLLANGSFNLKIKNTIYEVEGISDPAKQSNVLADVVIDTDKGKVYFSLKENSFFSYGGISSRGREYQKEMSTLESVKEYISKFRKHLIDLGNCEEVGDKILCDPKGKRYYSVPEYNQKFIDFILFGSEKYKDEKDYADYVIIEDKNKGEILKEIDGIYSINPDFDVKERGDKIENENLPVFLSRFRKAVKKDLYGFIKTRTLIARKKFVGNAIEL